MQDFFRRALVRLGSRHRSLRLRPVLQRTLLTVAIGIFVVGGILTVRSLGLDLSELSWGPLLLVGLVGVPATAALNAVEYSISARVLGHRVIFLSALRVSLLSTAANLLPLPGGPVVRVQALHGLGSGYAKATASTASIGLFWVGISGLVAGLWVGTAGQRLFGALLVLGGGLSVAAGYALLNHQVSDARARVGLLTAIVSVEVALVALQAVRLLLVLQGLGEQPILSQALVLTLGGVIAAAVGLFPGGLGLRELLAAGLAPLVSMSPALAFLASAADRVLGIFFYSPIAVALLLRSFSGKAGSLEVDATMTAEPLSDDHTRPIRSQK